MLYRDRDLQTDDEGEILLERGDFVLATPMRTAIQLTNFLMLTNFGEYTPQPRAAANLGEFIGAPNIRRTHNLMMANAYAGARVQGALGRDGLDIVIEPIGPEEAGVLVRIRAAFEAEEGEEGYGTPILGFKYPFPTAQLEKVDVDS